MQLNKIFFLFLYSLLFFYISVGNLSAFDAKGSGFGKDIKQAKQNALSDLSQQISVRVDSAVVIKKRKQNSDVSSSMYQNIETRSSLPLIGVSFSEPKKYGDQYIVYAEFGPAHKEIYKKALDQKKILIDQYKQESESGTYDKRIKYLQRLIEALDEFRGYQAVGLWLGIDPVPEVDITKESVLAKLGNFKQNADSMDLGASLIFEKLTADNKLLGKEIFIYPPSPSDSDEITPFAKAFYKRLSTKFKNISSPERANVRITGEYSVENKNIDLLYRACDISGKIISSGFVKLTENAYKGYSPESSLKDFSKLIKEGVIVSSDFNVELTTSKGKNNLLFEKGDTVSLFVRMNKPGSFYILAHNLKKDKYSYLLDFYDSKGNEKFIFTVSPEMVNKWVSIGEFEVVPPYGVEKVQIFASTDNLEAFIPKSFYDTKTGLYKLGEMPKEAVSKTRGLVRKSRIHQETATAENYITITTSN